MKYQETEHLVFVYGTLLRGMGNHRRLTGAAFLGEFETVERYHMSSPRVGGFPKVDPRRLTHVIKGELYLVDGPIRDRLDRLEGHPDFFTRGRVDVVDASGKRVEAEMYFYDRDQFPGDVVVPGGDWRAFIIDQRKTGAIYG